MSHHTSAPVIHTASSRERVYYTSERGYYVPHPESNTTFVVEKEKPVWSPCLWILAAIFIVFVIALIVVLIAFFTLGALAQPASAASKGNATTRKPGATGGGGDNGAETAVAHPRSVKFQLSEAHYDRVNPEWVQDAIAKAKRKICLLDTAVFGRDPQAEFDAEHIPGAVRFDINAVAINTPFKRRQLVNESEFEAYAQSLGIDADCHVIAYDHPASSANVSKSAVSATYVWWLFKVYGHDLVSIMHGGLKRWKERGFPVVSSEHDERTPTLEGNFKAFLSSNVPSIATFEETQRLVDADVQAETRKTQLLDVRPLPEFLGKSVQQSPKFGGHILGAIDIPITRFLNSDGSALIDLPDAKRLLEENRLDLEKFTIVYDNTGLYASAVYFMLVEMGVPAKLYDGGWVEWSNRAPNNLSVHFKAS